MKKVIFWIMIVLLIGCSGMIGYSIKKCDCDYQSDDEIKESGYRNLNDKLIEYLDDIYNNEEWMNGGLEATTYKVTLKDLKDKGYDISMFVNPTSKLECHMDNTYGEFIILGTTEDGKTDYTYRTNVSCPISLTDEEIENLEEIETE